MPVIVAADADRIEPRTARTPTKYNPATHVFATKLCIGISSTDIYHCCRTSHRSTHFPINTKKDARRLCANAQTRRASFIETEIQNCSRATHCKKTSTARKQEPTITEKLAEKLH